MVVSSLDLTSPCQALESHVLSICLPSGIRGHDPLFPLHSTTTSMGKHSSDTTRRHCFPPAWFGSIYPTSEAPLSNFPYIGVSCALYRVIPGYTRKFGRLEWWWCTSRDLAYVIQRPNSRIRVHIGPAFSMFNGRRLADSVTDQASGCGSARQDLG